MLIYVYYAQINLNFTYNLKYIIQLMHKLSLLLLIFFLAACEKNQPGEMPPAETLTRDAIGYYCLMTVVNHGGPKGQIILSNNPEAIWFSSVSETIFFYRSPEEPKNIAAVYVNDMSHADININDVSDANWNVPGINNWIDAYEAWYVVGSDRVGGMGAPEAVPFSTEEKAALFASQQGGKIYRFAEIPQEYLIQQVYPQQ